MGRLSCWFEPDKQTSKTTVLFLLAVTPQVPPSPPVQAPLLIQRCSFLLHFILPYGELLFCVTPQVPPIPPAQAPLLSQHRLFFTTLFYNTPLQYLLRSAFLLRCLPPLQLRHLCRCHLCTAPPPTLQCWPAPASGRQPTHGEWK